MFRKLFKGQVILEAIADAVFVGFLVFVMYLLVYHRELYQNLIYMIIAAVVFVVFLFCLYRTIRDLANL